MSENSLKNGITDEVLVHKNPVLRWIFLFCGFVLVGVGILGMFLPLLPTTIFFILAAWCFARSSERFHHWLHNNRLFGKYLNNYRINKGMTVKSKLITILVLTAGITISMYFAAEHIIVKILLAAIWFGVCWHIIALKTVKEEQ